MKGAWSAAVGLLLLVALDGCKGVVGPDWTHPGTASAQQKRALRYDPYPDTEPGASATNTRPREYDIPPPEASQARWQLGNWGQ